MKKYVACCLLVIVMACSTVLADDNPITLLGSLDQTYTGTAVYVKTKSGKIVGLTNKHLCIGQSAVFLTHDDGDHFLSVVKKISDKFDLCLITAPTKTKYYELSESSEFGDSVTIIGHSGGDKLSVFSGILDKYVYVAIQNDKMKSLLHMTSLKVKPGSSGSPVLNSNNRIVALMSAITNEGNALVIPLEFIRDFLNDL